MIQITAPRTVVTSIALLLVIELPSLDASKWSDCLPLLPLRNPTTPLSESIRLLVLDRSFYGRISPAFWLSALCWVS